MPSNQFRFLLNSLILGLGLFWLVPTARAAVVWQQSVQISIGTGEQKITVFDGKFSGGTSVAAGDVDGDGLDEIIVGAGRGGGPHVEIYQSSGKKISSWFALDGQTKAGIFVAAGDLDGDGRAEIIIGPDNGYKPEIGIYDYHGQSIGALTAFEASYTGGVRVGVISAINGQAGKILAASGPGRDQEIRVFNWPSGRLEASWAPYGRDLAGNGLFVSGGWSEIFNQPVIVASPDHGRRPLVRVYGLSSRQLLAAWFAYSQSFKGGLTTAFRNDLVLTAPGVSGGPEIRQFTVRGHEAVSWLAGPANYRGGIRIAAYRRDGAITSLTVPVNQDPETAAAVGSKEIHIVLSKQELHLYQNGKLVSSRRVSTGKWSTPTPTGRYQTRNKTKVAYSRAYGLYMEYWMAITPDGKYGLHALPFWKLRGGGKYYEGASHIGTPVSHGCIRQTVAEAKSLFEWAPVGTPVTIIP